MWNRLHLHDGRECLFGGNGAVLVWNLCDGDPQPPFGAILARELEGNGTVGTHVQQEFPEVVIVIEGHGAARVNSAPVSLQPGVVVQIPLGHSLALENGSPQQSLRYLIVNAR